ncbi:Formate/nitrite transporter [Saccharata proteae CBS 121410]|uniref:Formate/nitrite transporter n=1 Tax=Saccharata proteae CBS 121410 TaxID=1314787 RepID=A0A9P4LZZ2_9PEZI|nr:Formate/nitrite transporter [Saccharata proteae CBS 121410]
MQKVDAHSPPETCRLITQSGLAKAALTWPDLILKSFIGGIFISMGALFDLIIAGGAIGVRANNPSLATLLSGLVFPIGFAMLTVTNVELATSNMFVMVYTLLQRRTTFYDLGRNWVVSYVGNLAGCLFFAGFLTWWTNSLSTDAEQSYAASGAASRVNQQWSVNFLRGVGCNWLVAMAVFFATAAKDGVSKIYGIWIPVTAFCVMGYQHCIANFFLVPVGMFYGADVSVGKYIYQSVIPVTLGNILGGVVFGGFVFWWLYGRDEQKAAQTGQPLSGEHENNNFPVTASGETLDAGVPRHDAESDLTRRGESRKGDEMV